MLRTRRVDGRIRFIALGVFVAVFLFVFLAQNFKNSDEFADAASLANFDPGYIISDWQMGNYNSMSEAEIQAFLTSKNPCNNRDYNYYLALSRNSAYKWHWENGHFVCLSEERFGDGEVIGSGETAARIIYRAAQDYRINPQALLVLLQKETSLVTDPIPNDGDYRKATGFGCPDTAPCSSEYYGFKNQVRKAAALFRTVLDGGWTNYPLGNNYVQYNPNPGCGGTVVNIRSLATSALYRYTPYQPNPSAIAAGYGTGDGCGAYGNRNFYLYFEDWFGGVIRERNIVNTDLEEGEYIIESALDVNKAIDISGGAEVAKSGTNIQIWEKNNTNAQKWKIVRNAEDGTYTIANPTTDKVLDVFNAGRKNGVNIQLWDKNGMCAQKWYIEKRNDTYIFTSVCSELVLDVSGGVSASGTNIQLWEENGTNAQKWRLKKIQQVEEPVVPVPIEEKPAPTPSPSAVTVEDGVYSLHPLMNLGKALDVENGSFANMANVQIYTFWNGNKAQEWEIKKKNGEDYYIVRNAHSRKALDVSNGVLSNGSNVWVYEENSTCAQRWKIEEQKDDTYIIRNACNDSLVLDVQDLHKNIQICIGWGDNNTAQKWKLNKLR
ncbi:RICIN domain-containing protein [Candidatus Saccharibacteria bacterium]|nr:RICIN domain-containing protein [Candidatus Saccharibacteria bacterium]